MSHKKIDFYHEVQVHNDAQYKKYVGLKGVVVGLSEDDNVVYGYAVLLYEKSNVVIFDKDDIFTTGNVFKREDFY